MSTILIVEDNDGHAALAEAVFDEIDSTLKLYRVSDVEQGFRFLAHTDAYASVPEPDLVLLDLNLPGRLGYDLLTATRAIPAWSHIGVVVFSTADSRRDRERSLALGAKDHIGKPSTLEAYETALRGGRYDTN